MRKTPFDFFAASGRSNPAIEAKSSKRLGSFPFERVEDHQVEGLKDYKNHNNPAWILLNFRKPRNVTYAVDIDSWIKLTNKLDRKSVPAALLKAKPFIEIPRIKIVTEDITQLIWDLRVLEGR